MSRKIAAAAFFPIAITMASGSFASTVDAVSFLTASHGFSIDGAAPGASPAGIVASVSGPTIDRTIESAVDDPDAVNITQNDVQIGNASSSPPIPFTYDIQDRTNRTDPTEFADARVSGSITSTQDEGDDIVNFALATRDVTREGLAQVRITSDPVAAAATSAYGLSRTNSYENVTDAPITFTIEGYFDAFLLSRYSGGDGFARAATSWDILFSGHTAGNLTYIPLDTFFTSFDEIGTGGFADANLVSQPSGVEGISLTAATSALGSGGFTEASATAEHDFLFRLTVDPGQTVDMAYGFSQVSVVEFDVDPAVVPLPASAVLLFGALGGLFALRRRRA
ncbi:MAG: VPLPA-CTERM sorting domain-containing protein [Roseovarius sp.]|uniref:VPLPA-CTERM sorting domain-containing protein n=2 Tax=Roseovarius sp. TaxID=1486281 RepID=UPI0032ECC999